MVREPKSAGQDAWKRWLRNGAKLFDRTWSGWALVLWVFSAGIVYVSHYINHLAAIGLLMALSAPLFGAHQAVFDVLAAGKRGPSAWMGAIGRDLVALRASYLRSALVRTCIAIGALLVVAGVVVWLASLGDPDASTPKEIDEDTFWSSWSVWVWAWLIPAGWQKCGAFGWGHWLVRRERVPMEIAQKLTSLGIALNASSYARTVLAMMAPAIFLMIVFPPLLPIWDVYVAAVCWCIWDEVFGDGNGLKEMETKKVAAPSASVMGA